MQRAQINKIIPFFVMLVLLFLVVAIRLRLLEVPLERDEGEYAYGAQILLHGGLPYVDFYSMKLPGIYFLYSIFIKFFGDTQTAIHLGLLCINILSIFLVYILGKRLFSGFAGLFASASYALLILGQTIQGAFANAEDFVNLFIIAAFLFLAKGFGKDRKLEIIISGVLVGVALLIKQHSIFFIPFFVATLWISGKGLGLQQSFHVSS